MESRIRVVTAPPTHKAARGALALDAVGDVIYKQLDDPSGTNWTPVSGGTAVQTGSGDPNGVVTGDKGSLYQNTAVGNQFWMNTDGVMAWRLLLPHGEYLSEKFAQTNDASAATLDTIAVPADTIVFIESTIVAQDEVSATRECAAFKINKVFKLVSGAPDAVGPEDRLDINEIAGLLCYWTVAGTDAVLVINGHASDQVGWHAVTRITYSRAIPGGA